MKKMFIAMMVAVMLTGCNEAPTATIEPEGKENIITESIIVENVDDKEEKRKNMIHPWKMDINNDDLWRWYLKDREAFDKEETEENGKELIEDLGLMEDRLEDDDWFHLENGEAYVSGEFIRTLGWNVHDILEYGDTLR